jgi:hypothetical protein
MKRALIAATIATAVYVQAAQAQEDRTSANYMLPYCRAWLHLASLDRQTVEAEIRTARARPGGVVMHFTIAGMCAGVVVGISTVLLSGSGDVKACIPDEVSNEQLVRVVVNEAEKFPEFMHFNFSVLVSAALKTVWPCKDK